MPIRSWIMKLNRCLFGGFDMTDFNVYFLLHDMTTRHVILTGLWENIQRDIQGYIMAHDLDVIDFDYEGA